MNHNRTQIRSLTLVNFRGIFFKTLEMHPLMTNLIGHNGAGKTTIMGALLVNRVPDNRLVRLRNNSDSGQDRSDNGIWGRINAGTCYSLTDYITHDGKRVIAGVQLKRLSQPRVELKLFAINDIDSDIPVRDLVMKPVPGEGQRYEALDGKALRNQISLLGGELIRFDTTAQYMEWQFNQRIIPRRMENSQDRQRYYRMLETSLYGGLSSELQKGLRDYLLPADHQVRQSIGSMQNALKETQRTRSQIESSRSDRKVIRAVLDSSYDLGEHVLAWSEKQQTRLQNALQSKQQQQRQAEDQLETRRQQLVAIETRLEVLETLEDELAFREEDIVLKLEQAKDLERLHTHLERLADEHSNHSALLETLNEQKAQLDDQYQEQSEELELLQADVTQLVDQLTSVQQAYSEEARKAGLYLAAERALNEVRSAFHRNDLQASELAALLDSHLQVQQEASEQYYQQLPLLEQAENIRRHFEITLSHLDRLGDTDVPLNQAASRADHWLLHGQQQEKLAARIPLLQQQHQQCQQDTEQLKRLKQALLTLPETWHSTIQDQQSYNGCLETASRKLQELQEHTETVNRERDLTANKRNQLQSALNQARMDHVHWSEARKLSQDILSVQPNAALNSSQDFSAFRQQVSEEQETNVESKARCSEQLEALRSRMRQLEIKASSELQQLQRLAELTGGVVISDYFDNDDISLEEAAWLEAKFGPLRHAIQIKNIDKAAAIIREESDRPDHIWLLSGEPGSSFSEDDYLHTSLDQKEDGSVLVEMGERIARLSHEPVFPTIGRLAREKEQLRLQEQEENLLDQLQTLAIRKKQLERCQGILDQLSARSHWLGLDEPPVTELVEQIREVESQFESHTASIEEAQRVSTELNQVVRSLEQWQNSAWLLDDDATRLSLSAIKESLQQAEQAQYWLDQHLNDIQQLQSHRLYIEKPPVEDLDELREQLNSLRQQLSLYSQQKDLLSTAISQSPNLRFLESVARQEETDNLQKQLKVEYSHKKSSASRKGLEVEQLRLQCSQLATRITSTETLVDKNLKDQAEARQQISEIPLTWHDGIKGEYEQQLSITRKEKADLARELVQKKQDKVAAETDRKQTEELLNNTIADIHNLQPRVEQACDNYSAIITMVEQSGQQNRLHTHHLRDKEDDILRNGLAAAKASLTKALETEQSSLYQRLLDSNNSDLPTLFQCFVDSQRYLAQRMDKTLYQSDDPRQNLEKLEEHLTRLETLLKDAEKRFLAESDSLGQNIQRKINKERKQIHQLNAALSSVHFGTVRSIKIELEVIDSFQKILDALQQEFYADLFQKPEMTVESALEYLFKKETGGTIVGDKLLDYREYIRLKILIKRAGSQHYEPANPTNLSTGEAIGTGLAILTMVLHSWEVTTENRYGKGHAASRLLFLDEAARLDARALATLEELCGHQSLQLLVGAPDNVLPKNGVTWRMVRLMEPYEHVIFSGVKGRLPQVSES